MRFSFDNFEIHFSFFLPTEKAGLRKNTQHKLITLAVLTAASKRTVKIAIKLYGTCTAV